MTEMPFICTFIRRLHLAFEDSKLLGTCKGVGVLKIIRFFFVCVGRHLSLVFKYPSPDAVRAFRIFVEAWCVNFIVIKQLQLILVLSG